jgi:hypothetical protein
MSLLGRAGPVVGAAVVVRDLSQYGGEAAGRHAALLDEGRLEKTKDA